ncbi:DUF4153 domain-containing protein [Brevundimonas sp. FT23028]|uniref:DUF4153 domain-containing protein n=1 Tax=Brevundimonas sp. FT23028 TaxID=3393748 RepID=UPI003B587AF8
MSDAIEATGRNSLGRAGTPALAGFRLAVGLLQGAALWWLYRSAEVSDYSQAAEQLNWPANVPELFGPLSMILVMVPVLLLAGAGRMRIRTLVLWALGATVFLALLGWHGVAAQSITEYGPRSRPPYLPWPMPLFAGAALFIGHHLVLPADLERRWIAAFPTYFDTAWKAGVQLALSVGFTGAFWILLFLGAALFRVIGLTFLSDLIAEDWFFIPVTTLMFATAVHLTDVRDALIRGVRSVALMLLSWLLLLMTVLAAGFLAALPFTGLDSLWDTGSATALVLTAAAALIILINTAYQDGRADNLPPRVLQWAVRLAAVLLTPLVILAFWGLALRIGQHGLTPDRIIAVACALIGAAYAGGYGYAALLPFTRSRRGKGTDWMQPLERTNVLTAVLEVAVILALFSPLADPARLSVADQVARLERGAVKPDQFDFRFLRFESGKAGEAALERLTRSSSADVAERARRVAAIRNRWDSRDEGEPDRIPVFEVVGSPLPADFVTGVRPDDDRYACVDKGTCVAQAIDLNGDNVMEVLIARSFSIDLWARNSDGVWTRQGAYPHLRCVGGRREDARERLKQGGVRIAEPRWPALAFGDGPAVTPQLEQDIRCAPASADATAPVPVTVTATPAS